jgi:hypothetical protein
MDPLCSTIELQSILEPRFDCLASTRCKEQETLDSINHLAPEVSEEQIWRSINGFPLPKSILRRLEPQKLVEAWLWFSNQMFYEQWTSASNRKGMEGELDGYLISLGNAILHGIELGHRQVILAMHTFQADDR